MWIGGCFQSHHLSTDVVLIGWVSLILKGVIGDLVLEFLELPTNFGWSLILLLGKFVDVAIE